MKVFHNYDPEILGKLTSPKFAEMVSDIEEAHEILSVEVMERDLSVTVVLLSESRMWELKWDKVTKMTFSENSIRREEAERAADLWKNLS